MLGRKVGTATITKSGTAGQRCVFSASEIAAKAPAGRHVMRLVSANVSYGKTESIVVPVI